MGVPVERELRVGGKQKEAARSYRSRALEEAVEVKHLKGVLLERKLPGDAAGSY